MTAVKKYALLPLCGLTLFCARAQMPATNYDESQVPAYTLPDPLTTIAGKKVTDAETWISERRPELLSLFESEVYGKAPGRPEGLHFEVLSEDRYTLGNMATRREIAVYFTESDAHFMTILLYIPNKRTDAVPVFLGLNFKGNHTICDDPLVTESVSRIKPREEGGSEVRAKGFPRSRGGIAVAGRNADRQRLRPRHDLPRRHRPRLRRRLPKRRSPALLPRGADQTGPR